MLDLALDEYYEYRGILSDCNPPERTLKALLRATTHYGAKACPPLTLAEARTAWKDRGLAFTRLLVGAERKRR